MNTLDYILHMFHQPVLGNNPVRIQNFDRNMLAKLFYELEFKRGVEIGTEKGYYAETLCKENPQMKLFCVDPWAASEDYLEHRANGKHESNYRQTLERMRPYNCELIRKPSMEAVKDFENESLDFVYIDGDHSFAGVANDILQWSKKVRPGGIIAGHDYEELNHHGKPNLTHHVIEAVDGWTKAYKISPWFLLSDEHGTFLWVK